MSRNLAQTTCDFCHETPTLDEQPRPVTREECGVYFDEYEGMMVANATCQRCKAKYLAWVEAALRMGRHSHYDREGRPFFDLSFRSSFNDEPGREDLPEFEVIMEPRLIPWPHHCPKCGGKVWCDGAFCSRECT